MNVNESANDPLIISRFLVRGNSTIFLSFTELNTLHKVVGSTNILIYFAH